MLLQGDKGADLFNFGLNLADISQFLPDFTVLYVGYIKKRRINHLKESVHPWTSKLRSLEVSLEVHGASLEFHFQWNVEHLKHENGLKLVKNGQKFTICSILVDCEDKMEKDCA